METIQPHLFAEPVYTLVQASSGKRFANYLIDLLIFYVLMFILGIILGLLNLSIVIESSDSSSFGLNLLDRLFSLFLYGIYMGVVEGIFKGKSVGKFITRTRAVNDDGTSITTGKAFLRGLSRAVPFNAFSALGHPSYPWHDRWTNSYVIDERESNYPGNS